jgi:DNA repair exonuclease SbcCD ATPase subunit
LRNFRKYRHAEVEFPEGVVGVVGPNGSGKTTLFEAVAWALYGNGMSRTGGFGLSSTAAGAGAPCEAELVFERAGALFRVVRRLTYGGTFTWAQVFEGSERVADGARASDLLLNQIVGLEARPFLRTLYARQGELAGLAKDTPGFRRRFIVDLLGKAAAPQCPLCEGVLGPGARSRLEKQRVELLSEAAALRVRERALAGAGEGQRRREERTRLEEAAAKEATLRARLAESVRQAAQRKQTTVLRSLEELLQEFEAALIARFLPALEREVSVLLSSATAGRYTRALLDKEFNIRMEDGGRSYVLSRFSGGEQDVASLALRLGLLRLATRAPPIECVVLDEVFGSQDRERRRGVMRALLRLCPPFRQIFVVTHAEEVQELLPHLLRVAVGPE